MKIKIGNKRYELKYTLRAMIIFEKITKKPFSLDNLTDQLVYFYAILMANNPSMKLSLDDLIDAIDKDQNILTEYLDFLRGEQNKANLLSTQENEEEKDKKKD